MNAPNISEEYIINRQSEIGTKLKAAREAKGLSVDQVAEITNLSRYNINRIEGGRWNWDAKFFILYLRAIECNIEIK